MFDRSPVLHRIRDEFVSCNLGLDQFLTRRRSNDFARSRVFVQVGVRIRKYCGALYNNHGRVVEAACRRSHCVIGTLQSCDPEVENFT